MYLNYINQYCDTNDLVFCKVNFHVLKIKKLLINMFLRSF